MLIGRETETAGLGQLLAAASLPKTVEYHLRKVFQKLDIASRNDLIRLFSGGQAPPELVAAAP